MNVKMDMARDSHGLFSCVCSSCLCLRHSVAKSIEGKLLISSCVCFFSYTSPSWKKKRGNEKMHMPLSFEVKSENAQSPSFLLKIHMVREFGIMESVKSTPCKQVSSSHRPRFAIWCGKGFGCCVWNDLALCFVLSACW